MISFPILDVFGVISCTGEKMPSGELCEFPMGILSFGVCELPFAIICKLFQGMFCVMQTPLGSLETC
jgi:hypothetical protein